jgi:hypothetical protein
MMYSDKFVICIKVGGKILRETKDLVHLPFGSEFSVLVKNLNSRRAKFTLHIDGADVLDGTEIIVDANDEVEMKRFIRNGNMNEGNAFRFIERTAAIEDGPRGVKIEDGIVRVEFWFEKEKPEVKTTIHNHQDVWWDSYYRRYPHRYWYNDQFYSTNMPIAQTLNANGGRLKSANIRGMSVSNSADSATASSVNCSYNETSLDAPSADKLADVVLNDVGITVPGSKVEQKFHTVYGFQPEANSHVVILRLAGTLGNVQIAAPVTVKTKNKCVTCGHINKATSKYCSECGTALELV